MNTAIENRNGNVAIDSPNSTQFNVVNCFLETTVCRSCVQTAKALVSIEKILWVILILFIGFILLKLIFTR